MTAPGAGAALVAAFCAAWPSRDVAAITAFLDPDCVWENVPTGPVHGRAAIAEKLAAVLATVSAIEFEVLAIAENPPGTVLTERVDRMVVAGRPVALRLMGIFTVVDDRITLWRDYFDLASYREQLGGTRW